MLRNLPKDIYELLENAKDRIPDSAYDSLGNAIAQTLRNQHQSERRKELRMSQFGTPCRRKLWYSINRSEEAEPFPGKALFKFDYGHIIEAYTLWLGKLTGKHKITGEQDELVYEGVVGHRDAVVDGILVDVKSANARGMDKFNRHTLEQDDPFGYLDQLSMYSMASREDPLVEVKKEAAFIAVDKENGDIVIDVYKTKNITREDVEQTKRMLSQVDPPARHYRSQTDGKSGNEAIPFQCSYCQFKRHCWSDSNGGKGLRGFLYATGIKWLSKVVREPDVWEVPTETSKSEGRLQG